MKELKDYKIHTFSTGAQIVLYPVKGIKFTTCVMGFKTGALSEVVPGTAHFLEHNLFLGTKKRNRKQIDIDNSKVCYLNAATSLYYTLVQFKRANSQLNEAFEFASDILLNTEFNDKEIKTEREVVRNEILMAKERDKRNVNAYHSVLVNPYQKNYTCNVLGQNIDLVTKKVMQEFREQNYVAKNFVMVVISNLSMSTIIKYYKKYVLPDLKIDNDAEDKSYDIVPSNPSKMQVINLDQDKVDFAMSIAIPYGIHQLGQAFSQVIFADYLNNDSIYNDLRKKGLIYSAYFAISKWNDNSILKFKCTCSKENINKIIDVVAKDLKQIYKDGINKEDFDNICKQLVISNDEREAFYGVGEAMDLAYTHLVRGLLDKFDFKKLVKKITLKDVNEYIKLYDNIDNKLWITVLGDIKEDEVYSFEKIKNKLFTNK